MYSPAPKPCSPGQAPDALCLSAEPALGSGFTLDELLASVMRLAGPCKIRRGGY